MLTIFTCPKAFHEHSRIIQRNALRSWIDLGADVEILLAGDDAGVERTAKEFGVIHAAGVETNAFGTPLVSSIFELACATSTNKLLAYVNADIVLGPEFINQIKRISKLNTFLMTGRRWDLDVEERLDSKETSVWNYLQPKIRKDGTLHGPEGLDYFVFTRDLAHGILPFAIGRPAWDNWFLGHAHKMRSPMIDASAVITAIHQNHSYEHVKQSVGTKWEGPEGQTNRILSPGHCFTINDCDYVLNTDRLVRARKNHHIEQRVRRLQKTHTHLWRSLHSWKLRRLLCYLFPRL